MKKNVLFALWGVLFALCAGFGFVVHPGVAAKILMTMLSVVFFLPPALLLHQAASRKDRPLAQLIRNLSAASLAVTLVLIIANFLSAFGSATLGNILHNLLVILSAPMVCSQYWVLSLFLWACLMVSSVNILKRK